MCVCVCVQHWMTPTDAALLVFLSRALSMLWAWLVPAVVTLRWFLLAICSQLACFASSVHEIMELFVPEPVIIFFAAYFLWVEVTYLLYYSPFPSRPSNNSAAHLHSCICPPSSHSPLPTHLPLYYTLRVSPGVPRHHRTAGSL